ncbi:hypothetical protein SAMN05421753_111123 [Planctomicrobium piriforme]|uniref:Uncharacterized protein n=1 Tax=Planctomicrobium piriforme TaxID=1576369 RepID=A0A1I3K5C5_9PLAN|nr:hypothetical protein SAMN05421753_111123 [Planctomicrobium piriforme]
MSNRYQRQCEPPEPGGSLSVRIDLFDRLTRLRQLGEVQRRETSVQSQKVRSGVGRLLNAQPSSLNDFLNGPMTNDH